MVVGHKSKLQIGRDFAEQLASAHEGGCPWRTAQCDASLAAFPPLERHVIAQGFEARVDALGRLNVLPPIAEGAYAAISATRRCLADQPCMLCKARVFCRAPMHVVLCACPPDRRLPLCTILSFCWVTF